METISISAESVEQAARDLAPHLQPTPLQFSRAFTDQTRCQVHVKLEGMQPIRAFKVRGALNKVLLMLARERAH